MINIAIDGPAGAGKSTVAREVAKELKIVYLDTGAMYRAVALKCLRKGLDPNDEAGVMTFLNDTEIRVAYEDGAQHIFLDGEDVSEAIRENRISRAASDISKLRPVRLKLVELQRGIARSCDVVMDGRDIGTYVLPDANFKFFLTATSEERASRRYLELIAKGEKVKYEDVLADIVARDENDSSRDFAPLKRAEDAVLVDTSKYTAREVVAMLIDAIDEKRREGRC